MRLPKSFKAYFWDVDFNKVSLKKHMTLILSRILKFGDSLAVRWMFKNFSVKKIKTYILKFGDKQLDRKSNNFWRIYFGLPLRRKTNPIWPY